MRTKYSLKSLVSGVLAAVMMIGNAPTISVLAAQSSSDYIDPADHWTTTGNRANELDANATVTEETQHCGYCDRDTEIVVHLKGGDLNINYAERVFMTGPAEIAFTGVTEI